MRILVTGSNGQLASEIKNLVGENADALFFFTDSTELNITDKVKFLDFVSLNKIDAIINCAAYTAVDNAEDNFELANEINHLGVKNIDEIALLKNLKYMHISTDYVFDGKSDLPFIETDTVNPKSVYGKTKRLGEEVVINSKSNSVVIRTSWVYSEFGNNFVKTMMRLGKEKDELNVIFDQIGTPTYARDLARVCLKIIQNERLDSKSKIYHYSNEGVCSWYDFAYSIMDYAKINCKVNPIESIEYPTKAERPIYSVLNKKLIKSHFEIEIPHWTISLKECINKLK